jgi:hypothetical protein
MRRLRSSKAWGVKLVRFEFLMRESSGEYCAILVKVLKSFFYKSREYAR